MKKHLMYWDETKKEPICFCSWCGEPISDETKIWKVRKDLICQSCNESRFEQFDRE